MRQRPDRAVAQRRRDLGEQRAREIGPLDRQLVHVDREIGDILPQRPQMDAAVQVEVALAEFEEAAERLQHAEALLHRLAAERIQHDIDAVPPVIARTASAKPRSRESRTWSAPARRRKARFTSDPAVAITVAPR